MYCKNCGTNIPEGKNFCPNCGTPTGATSNNSDQTVYQGTVQGKGYHPNIEPRNIALAIIFSIITCGIYSIYWFIKLTDESIELANEPNETSGGIAFLLTLVTCGIYGWYWAYKLGNRVDKINNNPSASTDVIFIILQIFGLGIVNYAIAQDAINKAV